MQTTTHQPTASGQLHAPLHDHHGHHVDPVPLQVAVEHPEKVGKPDGIPHDVIGMLAFGIALLAGLTLITWLTVGLWLAVLVAIVAGFLMLRGLPNRSGRERKSQAPRHVREHVLNHEEPHQSHDEGHH